MGCSFKILYKGNDLSLRTWVSHKKKKMDWPFHHPLHIFKILMSLTSITTWPSIPFTSWHLKIHWGVLKRWEKAIGGKGENSVFQDASSQMHWSKTRGREPEAGYVINENACIIWYLEKEI